MVLRKSVPRLTRAAIPVAAFCLSLAVYNRTLTPSLSYNSPDGNELVTICYQVGLAHPSGYPLYTWLGKLFTFLPIGDVAHRINLMSAMLGAGGVALLYAIARLLGISRLVAAFTGLFFAFSLTFWSQTVIAEVYAPNLFMVTLTLYWLLRWAAVEEGTKEGQEPGSERSAAKYLVAFALSFGLSLGTHLSDLGFAPAFALFIVMVRRRVIREPKLLAIGVAAFLLGAAQFLWIPYRGAEVINSFTGAGPIAFLLSLYKYTLGAFTELRFAFPVSAIPDRIVLYLELLRQNLTGIGIIIGLLGLWVMLFRDTRRFYLFATMYLVHLFFFLQYRVFDLDVFFIPSHLLYAVFVGYGLQSVVRWASITFARVRRWLGRAMRQQKKMSDTAPKLPAPWPRPLVWSSSVVLAVLLFFLLAGQLKANYSRNDRSQDTIIGDFYRNVYAILPQDSIVWTHGAVFAYDIGYYQLAYGVRPDVKIPMLQYQGSRPPEAPRVGEGVFSTVRPNPQGLFQPPIPTGDQAWYTPVLVAPVGAGAGLSPRELTLYRIRRLAPELVVNPTEIAADGPGGILGNLQLVGYRVEPRSVERGDCLHITYYWRILRLPVQTITTGLSQEGGWFERHDLGFGSLRRYTEERQPPALAIFKEDFQLVVPSSTPPGNRHLRVGVNVGTADPLGGLTDVRYLDLGSIEVSN